MFDDLIARAALQADREINTEIRQALKLNYAFYQGGTISTTRPFCKVRNNKVFSREEISKFSTSRDKYGGYENKSSGELQGKTKPHNPFLDLGGYNCRHSYDWISDELAAIFRPELIKEGFNEIIKVKGGTTEVHKDHIGMKGRKISMLPKDY